MIFEQMLVRLFKPAQRAPLLGLGILGWLTVGSACDPEFTANGTPSGGQGGSSGASSGTGGELTSEAGESGIAEAGSGGAPTDGSAGEAPTSAGSAGKPTTGCDCLAGEYCQDGTSNCRKCTDFGRFEFAPAQKFTTLAQSPQSVERSPRSAAAGSALFYVSGAADNAKILYAAAPASGVGTPLTVGLRIEHGPLYVRGFAEQNLFFDRQQAGGRKLLMALWTAPALVTKEALVPGLINARELGRLQHRHLAGHGARLLDEHAQRRGRALVASDEREPPASACGARSKGQGRRERVRADGRRRNPVGQRRGYAALVPQSVAQRQLPSERLGRNRSVRGAVGQERQALDCRDTARLTQHHRRHVDGNRSQPLARLVRSVLCLR